jgi:hypothetical protein
VPSVDDADPDQENLARWASAPPQCQNPINAWLTYEEAHPLNGVRTPDAKDLLLVLDAKGLVLVSI